MAMTTMKDWVETYLAKDDNEYEIVESIGHMMVEWYNEHGWINASEKFDNVMEGLLVNVRPAIMKRCRELMEACEEKPAETTQDREEWEANQVQLPHPDPQGALATVFSSFQPISQEEHDEHVQELEDWSLELEQLAATIGIDTARGESLQDSTASAAKEDSDNESSLSSEDRAYWLRRAGAPIEKGRSKGKSKGAASDVTQLPGSLEASQGTTSSGQAEDNF